MSRCGKPYLEKVQRLALPSEKLAREDFMSNHETREMITTVSFERRGTKFGLLYRATKKQSFRLFFCLVRGRGIEPCLCRQAGTTPIRALGPQPSLSTIETLTSSFIQKKYALLHILFLCAGEESNLHAHYEH